jgi:hypothetical protein
MVDHELQAGRILGAEAGEVPVDTKELQIYLVSAVDLRCGMKETQNRRTRLHIEDSGVCDRYRRT